MALYLEESDYVYVYFHEFWVFVGSTFVVAVLCRAGRGKSGKLWAKYSLCHCVFEQRKHMQFGGNVLFFVFGYVRREFEK